MTPGPRPTERLEKTLARVAREQGIDQERLRRWVSFLALCGVLERAVSEGALGTYYLKGGVAMELRFAQRARATKDLDIGIDGARSQGTPPTPDAAGPPATGATRRNSPAVGLIRKPSISSLPPMPSSNAGMKPSPPPARPTTWPSVPNKPNSPRRSGNVWRSIGSTGPTGRLNRSLNLQVIQVHHGRQLELLLY